MFAIGIVLASLGVWLMIGATRLCLTVDDENTPEMLEAAVVWKHIHHGKPTTYDLDLSPWYRVPAYDVHLDL